MIKFDFKKFGALNIEFDDYLHGEFLTKMQKNLKTIVRKLYYTKILLNSF